MNENNAASSHGREDSNEQQNTGGSERKSTSIDKLHADEPKVEHSSTKQSQRDSRTTKTAAARTGISVHAPPATGFHPGAIPPMGVPPFQFPPMIPGVTAPAANFFPAPNDFQFRNHKAHMQQASVAAGLTSRPGRPMGSVRTVNEMMPRRGRKVSSPARGSAPSSPSKPKRPLPAGVSARNSTLPTPTIMGSNVLDEILGEAQDLLNAAAEAQALGRLKNANSYLVLAHARLVGLGKRFDLVASLALQRPPHSSSSAQSENDSSSATPKSKRQKVKVFSSKKISSKDKESGAVASEEESMAENQTNKQLNEANGLEKEYAPTETNDVEQQNKHPLYNNDIALQLMSKLLPTGVKLDKTMLEHLAKSAMELHQRRSGNSNVNEEQVDSAGTGVAWSAKEHDECMKLSKQGKTTEEIVQALGNSKNAAQVRAHLRVENEKEKAAAPVDLELKERIINGDSDVVENTSPVLRERRLTRFDAKEMMMGKSILQKEGS